MTFEQVIKVAEIVAPYLVIAGGWLTYKKKLRKEAASVAISYRFTIAAINESLKEVRDDVLEDAIKTLEALPSNTVSDYRKEDWFDVHRALSDRLGYLYHLDEAKGAEANRMVMQFYNRLKYVRDVWSYLIMLAGAAGPESSKVEGDDSGRILAKGVIERRMPPLEKKLKELIDLGDNTVKILDELLRKKGSAQLKGSESFNW